MQVRQDHVVQHWSHHVRQVTVSMAEPVAMTSTAQPVFANQDFPEAGVCENDASVLSAWNRVRERKTMK